MLSKMGPFQSCVRQIQCHRSIQKNCDPYAPSFLFGFSHLEIWQPTTMSSSTVRKRSYLPEAKKLVGKMYSTVESQAHGMDESEISGVLMRKDHPYTIQSRVRMFEPSPSNQEERLMISPKRVEFQDDRQESISKTRLDEKDDSAQGREEVVDIPQSSRSTHRLSRMRRLQQMHRQQNNQDTSDDSPDNFVHKKDAKILHTVASQDQPEGMIKTASHAEELSSHSKEDVSLENTTTKPRQTDEPLDQPPQKERKASRLERLRKFLENENQPVPLSNDADTYETNSKPLSKYHIQDGPPVTHQKNPSATECREEEKDNAIDNHMDKFAHFREKSILEKDYSAQRSQTPQPIRSRAFGAAGSLYHESQRSKTPEPRRPSLRDMFHSKSFGSFSASKKSSRTKKVSTRTSSESLIFDATMACPMFPAMIKGPEDDPSQSSINESEKSRKASGQDGNQNEQAMGSVHSPEEDSPEAQEMDRRNVAKDEAPKSRNDPLKDETRDKSKDQATNPINEDEKMPNASHVAFNKNEADMQMAYFSDPKESSTNIGVPRDENMSIAVGENIHNSQEEADMSYEDQPFHERDDMVDKQKHLDEDPAQGITSIIPENTQVKEDTKTEQSESDEKDEIYHSHDFSPEAQLRQQEDSDEAKQLPDSNEQYIENHDSPNELKAQKTMKQAYALSELGVQFLREGKLDEAKLALSKALCIRKELAPEESLSDLLLNLGTLANFMHLEEYSVSLHMYRHALDDLKAHDGPKSEIANALYNIGRVEVQRNQWGAAVSTLGEARLLSTEVYGQNHLHTAQVLDLLGIAFWNLAMFEAAYDCFHGSLNVHLHLYGRDHEETANSMYNIGMARECQQNLEVALIAYSDAQQVYENIKVPPDHPGLEAARMSIANIEKVLWEREAASQAHVRKFGIGRDY